MSEEAPLQGARILIVEDEFLIADDLAREIRNAGAEAIGPVASVHEAEELVRSGPVDAAIIDVNLRGKMASDFISRLAATDLPCLIVSGYGDDALPQSLSGIARLEKPVSPALVVKTLAKQIDRVV